MTGLRAFLYGRPESAVIIGTIAIVLFFTVGTDGAWLSTLPSVLRVTAQVGIIAVGQAMLMSSGEVDLSVGSVYATAAVVAVWAMDFLGLGVLPSAAVAIAASCLIGFANGVFTTKFNVPSMIVTLGAMFIFRGCAYIATKGFSLTVPREFRSDPIIGLLKYKIFGISSPFFALLLIAAAFSFVLFKTRFGSHVLSVGGDSAAALANGISPAATKIKAFVICSGLAGLSGTIVLLQQASVYSTSGIRLELEAIAAAVIGGCTLRGGSGSIWGPVLGVFALSSLKGGLMLMGAPSSWYVAFVGAMLIGFLVVSRVLYSGLAKARLAPSPSLSEEG